MKQYQADAAHILLSSISENRRETFPHGDEQFPCTSYLDRYSLKMEGYPWHWHDEWEIAYVERGGVTVRINDKAFRLKEGDGVFIGRRVLHAYSVCGTEAEMPNILFRPSLLYGSQESVYWKRYIKPLILSSAFSCAILTDAVLWQAEALKQARRAFSLLTAEAYGYEFRVRSALSEFVLQLCRNMPCGTERSAGQQSEIDRVRQILSFIQTHYTAPIQVQQIADSAFISRRECLRSFQSVIGSSPIQYVIALRLRKAKQLLLETDLPILDICAACGFQNQSYFTKAFREKTGTTPAQFRKRAR